MTPLTATKDQKKGKSAATPSKKGKEKEVVVQPKEEEEENEEIEAKEEESNDEEADTVVINNIPKTVKKNDALRAFQRALLGRFPFQVNLPRSTKFPGTAYLTFSSPAAAQQAHKLLAPLHLVPGDALRISMKKWHQSGKETVYISSLPRTINNPEFSAFCSQFGLFSKCTLGRNAFEGANTEYGFVHFSNREAAVNFFEKMKDAKYEGHKVVVALSTPKKEGESSGSAAKESGKRKSAPETEVKETKKAKEGPKKEGKPKKAQKKRE